MRFERQGAGVASAVGWVGCGGAMLGGGASLLCGDVTSLCCMGLVGVVGLVITVSKIRRLGGAVLAGTGVMMDVCWGALSSSTNIGCSPDGSLAGEGRSSNVRSG